MNFTELTKEEFQEFVDSHPNKNFNQTGYMYENLKTLGKEVYLLGIKNEVGTILCATLIQATGRSRKKTFEAIKGFLIDYNNTNLLKTFNDNIINFIKKKDGFRLFVEPYVALVERDIDGNIVDGGFDNRNQEKNILKLGYKPINRGISVKWVFALNTENKTEEEIWNGFKANTRNYINKTINKYKLNIRTLKYEELDQFKKITSDTCERRSFSDKSLEYYQSMYNAFKDLVTFKIVELNCDNYLSNLIEEKNELIRKINELSDSVSNQKKKENYKKELESTEKKLIDTTKLKEEKGNVIPLSAAMFILYGDEVIYLFSGSYKEYMNFFGQYLMQWDIIKYTIKNKYKRYNFYGIKDLFDKTSKDYGVYEFKKGFNGYVEELMPTYETGWSMYYKVYNFLKNFKNRIKRN